jgi:hypothetical protein
MATKQMIVAVWITAAVCLADTISPVQEKAYNPDADLTTVSLFSFSPLKTKLHGLSPRANYTDRAACRRSDCQFLRIEGCHVVSVTDPYGRILDLLDRNRYFSIT